MQIIMTLLFMLALNAPAYAQDKILNIQNITSPNGLNAWLSEDHSLPIISIKYAFKGAGAVNVPQDKQGLSQLLSNTMDEGAGELTSQQFQKALSDHSISLNFNSNRDNFGGTLTFLSREKEKATELLTLALNEPRFDTEPLDRMKQANITRIKSSQGDPNWLAARLYNDIAYAGHPYALNSGGTLTTIPQLSANDLRSFKSNFLTKDRLVISASGDITPQQLGQLIDKIFGALPSTGISKNISKIDIQNKGKIFEYKKDIPQSIITITMDSLDENNPDYYALQILNHIFGASGFGSRLMEEAREKRGLTYGIYSGLTNNEYLNALTISTSTKNDSVTEMLQIIKNQMVQIKKDDLTTEIKKAKDYMIGSLPLSLTSNNSIASILLGLQLKNRPIDYLNQYRKNIMKVTPTDIERVANKVLTPDNMLILITGKPTNLKNSTLITEVPNVE